MRESLKYGLLVGLTSLALAGNPRAETNNVPASSTNSSESLTTILDKSLNKKMRKREVTTSPMVCHDPQGMELFQIYLQDVYNLTKREGNQNSFSDAEKQTVELWEDYMVFMQKNGWKILPNEGKWISVRNWKSASKEQADEYMNLSSDYNKRIEKEISIRKSKK